MKISIRAWDRQKKIFVYPDLFSRSMPSNWLDFYRLQQGTHIVDKNGAEIYEGDILKTFSIDDGELIDVVEYEKGAFVLSNPFKLKWYLGDYKTENLEIIGNIHENPELINPL